MGFLWLVIKKNWQPIAILVIIGCVILSFQHIKVQRDAAIEDLSSYKLTQKILAIQEQDKQKDDLDKARAKIALNDVIAKNQLNDALNENQALKELADKLWSRYETKSSKPSMGNGPGIVLSPSGDSNTYPQVTSPSEGPSNGGAITDTTCAGLRIEKSELEQATAVETIFYNQCRAALDADALVCPRESAP
jgi:hypothetical protein